MRIKTEEAQAVVIELNVTEAGHIAADILSKATAAGTAAAGLGALLRDAGFYLEPEVSMRTEWAGPDN